MYEVKECTLPGGFPLPVIIVTEHIIQYAIEPVTLTDLNWMEDYAKAYLISTLVAGSIHTADISIDQTDVLASLSGTYDCSEMIANYDYKGLSAEHGKDG